MDFSYKLMTIKIYKSGQLVITGPDAIMGSGTRKSMAAVVPIACPDSEDDSHQANDAGDADHHDVDRG